MEIFINLPKINPKIFEMKEMAKNIRQVRTYLIESSDEITPNGCKSG
jgi:hypothetical protein